MKHKQSKHTLRQMKASKVCTQYRIRQRVYDKSHESCNTKMKMRKVQSRVRIKSPYTTERW